MHEKLSHADVLEIREALASVHFNLIDPRKVGWYISDTVAVCRYAPVRNIILIPEQCWLHFHDEIQDCLPRLCRLLTYAACRQRHLLPVYLWHSWFSSELSREARQREERAERVLQALGVHDDLSQLD